MRVSIRIFKQLFRRGFVLFGCVQNKIIFVKKIIEFFLYVFGLIAASKALFKRYEKSNFKKKKNK